MGRIFKFLTGRARGRGFTLVEAVMGTLIAATLVGSALMYMNTGMALTDMTGHQAMNQQAMRLPFMRVSRLVERAEGLEILSELPASIDANWSLIFASSADQSVYIRELSGDAIVDNKIPGFERVAALSFERIWFTPDGTAATSTGTESDDTGVRMTMTARGGLRLVDAAGTGKDDVPPLVASADLRSLNKANVIGEDSGPILKLESNVLKLEVTAIKHVAKKDNGDPKIKDDGHVEVSEVDDDGKLVINVGESYFGVISIVKGALDRELEYEWRVYDTKADANAQTGYAVIGKPGSKTADGDEFSGKYTGADGKEYDYDTLYGGNDTKKVYVDDNADAYTYFEPGTNKIISSTSDIKKTFLEITPEMEGKWLVLAARDASRASSMWEQSGLYLAHDIGSFGNIMGANTQLDTNDGGHRVILNVPGGENVKIERDYSDGESVTKITVDRNVEVPIISGRLSRRFFAHSRTPVKIDDGKGGEKDAWLRSREFCQENYTIWLDIQVDGVNADGTTSTGGTGGWGITLNGNTSRDMTGEDWDRTFGYMFQWDPGLAGDSSGLKTNRWKYVGGGHEKASANGYSFASAKGHGLHQNFEYYWNRGTQQYFMDLAPSNGWYRVAEGLIIRELPGLTNTGTAGISDIVRVHKIPKKGTAPDSEYFNVPSDPDTQLYSALFDQIAKTKKGGVTIKDIRYEDIEMKGNVTMRKAPGGSETVTVPRYEQLEYDDDDDDDSRNDISAHQWYTRADADWKKDDNGKGDWDHQYDRYRYLKDRLVAKVVNDEQMRYYQWGDLVYWPSPGPGLENTLETTTENYQIVCDDECDLYRKSFGLEPVDPSNPNGKKRFKSMVGNRYTVAINVVTQTKSAPYWTDPETGEEMYDPDRTVPVNVFCRVRVFDGVRRRIAKRYERMRTDYPGYYESQYRLPDGTWDENRWPVRRFPIEDEDGKALEADELTGRSRDAWFGFTVSLDETGAPRWIPKPLVIPKGDGKAEGPVQYLKNGNRVNFWTEDYGFIWNPRRMLTLWKNENYTPSDKLMWTYRKYENEGWNTKVTTSWTEDNKYSKGYGLGDTKEVLMENPDKWWFGNADSIYRPIATGGKYPYRKILGFDLMPTASEKTAYQRQEAFIVGPAVKTHWGEEKYTSATVATIKSKEGNDPDGNPNWLMVDDKIAPRADKKKKVPHGNNIMAGDVFYRVREDGLMIEKTMTSDKHGGSSGSSIGQDLALRIFAPQAAGARAQANIYFWDIEHGFPENYVFPWGQTLLELLPDGPAGREDRGDWNWYQAFEPVDGVKETAQEGLGSF